MWRQTADGADPDEMLSCWEDNSNDEKIYLKGNR